MLRAPFGAAMEGGGRALRVAALLVSAAILVVSFNGSEAAMADGVQQPATAAAGAGPETSVLCVSKCGTCPTVCSTPPQPTSPSSPSYGGIAPPATATPGSGAGGGSSSSPSHSTSPPAGQSKGGHPSNYYYFFTAGAGRCAGPSVYALVVLLVSVTLVASGFQ